MRLLKFDAWIGALLVFGWSTYQAFEPSALGLPQWIHTPLILLLGIRWAYFARLGMLQSERTGA